MRSNSERVKSTLDEGVIQDLVVAYALGVGLRELVKGRSADNALASVWSFINRDAFYDAADNALAALTKDVSFEK
jgi:hypothetical protein